LFKKLNADGLINNDVLTAENGTVHNVHTKQYAVINRTSSLVVTGVNNLLTFANKHNERLTLTERVWPINVLSGKPRSVDHSLAV